MKRLALAATLCVVASTWARGQSSTQGAVGGTIFDTTDAAIAKASVTIHNDGTNAEMRITTDESGYFNAPLLEPGIYTVTVSAPGFTNYRVNKVIVQVGLLTSLTPHLAPGQSAAVVEVTADVPVLNFDSPDFSASLNSRALRDVPVNNLRWSSLALTTPGVVSDNNGFGLVSVRGISPILNNVLIDGADDNQAYYAEERGRTREAYSTPPEAVREFNVNSGVYAAEFGRAAGGVINSVTNSGGNQLHGSAYFYDRESSWGAFNPYTNNTTGVQDPSTGKYTFTTSPYKPSDSRRIWGFSAGGAIIKDKLFWQYTYDQHHRNFPGTAKANSPSAFFSQPDATLASIAGSPTCDLTTGLLSGSTSTNSNYALDSQTCTLAARLHLVNYDAGATLYGNGLASLLPDLGTVPRTGDQVVNMPKLDWQINSKNHVSFLYNRLRWDSPGGVQTQATNNYAIDTFGMDFVKLDYGVAKLTSLLSSNISNELLYQYGRELNDEGQQPVSAYSQAHLTGAGGNIPEVALATSTGFFLGSPYYSYRKALPDERKWQIGDTLYLNHGNHSFKFGVDAVHNNDLINNTYESNGYITYGYLSNYLVDIANAGGVNSTCDSNALSAATSKNGTVTSAVGVHPCYSSLVQGFGPPVFAVSTFDYGVFAQDNWKVTPRLTVQLGLRYDYEALPGNSANSALTVASGTFSPYAGLTNAPSDKNNFGPRLGFAYDVFGAGKTVLRGGYGMYYGRITNGVLLNALLNTGSPLGQYVATIKPSASTAPVFPNVVSVATPPTPSSSYLASNLQNPMVHEFDLVLQQQVGRGTVFSLNYLGALGRELTNFVNTNLSTATTNTTITIADPSGKGPLANGATYVVPAYTSYVNKNFAAITEVASNVNSSYNAFVAEIQNRSLRSIQFDVNYTWSHALDYNQNAQTTTVTTGNSTYDPNGSQQADYGNSNYNVPNRLAGYVLYNLPNTHRGDWVKYLANDWAVNTSFQAQNGLPYSASLSGYVSSGALFSGWNGSGGGTWVPMLGRNTYKYPRDVVQDVRLQKQVPITERYHGELRLDVFNIYNHQNVTGVNSTAYALQSTGNTATATFQTGAAGSGTSQFGAANNSNSSGFLYTPRQVQIGFKLLF